MVTNVPIDADCYINFAKNQESTFPAFLQMWKLNEQPKPNRISVDLDDALPAYEIVYEFCFDIVGNLLLLFANSR